MNYPSVKNRINKFFAMIFISLILVITPACDISQVIDPGDFQEYTYSIFNSLLAGSEFNLHFLFKDQTTFGFEESYEPSLPTPSAGGSFLGYLYINAYFGAVKSYDYDQLTFDQKMTYNLIVDLVDNYNDTPANSGYLTNSFLGSYLGYQAQLPILFSEYKFYKELDIINYFKFIDLIPETFKAYYEFEVTKADNGFGMPNYTIEKVIAQCESLLATIDNHFLITTFANRVNDLDFLTTEQISYYQNLNVEKITGPFKEGYQFLKDNLPNLFDRSTNDAGLSYYTENDLGKKVYQKAFRQATGYDIDIDEAIQYLETKIASIRNRLITLQTQYPTINNDYQTTILNTNTPYDQVNNAKTIITSDFPEISHYPNIFIKNVDSSMEDHFSPAAYISSPIDEYENEFIYLNNKKIDQQGPNYLYTTLAHEGIAGHLYQNIYFKSLEDVNILRKVLKNGGYVEGWATYTELYSYNFVTDVAPHILEYMRLIDEINGAIYCRLDLGINYQGWLAQDIVNYTGTSSANAQAILEQLVEVYTNPLKYYFPYFKFVDMRERVISALGTDYDPIEFHKILLDCGPVPLRYIEVVIDEYIAKYLEDKK